MSKGMLKIDENVISPYRSLTITNPSLPDNKNWQLGSLKCDASNAGLTFKSAPDTFIKFDARNTIADETITSTQIQNGTIDTDDLHDLCVTNDKIANRTINHIKVEYRTLTDDEMADESISTRALIRGSVVDSENDDESKIAYRTILNRSLADGCVSIRNMQGNSVGTLQIIDGAVINQKIATNTIENDKLKDNTIDYNKIKEYGIIGGEVNELVIDGQRTIVKGSIAPRTITGWNIAEETINTINYKTGSITNEKFGDEEIYGSKIKPLGIETNHINNRAVTSDKVAEQGIETINIKDNNVTHEKLSTDLTGVVDSAVTYDENNNVTMMRGDGTDLTIGSGSVVNGIRNSDNNGSINVYGSIQADKVYNMAYSDLAEGYLAGEKIEPGEAAYLREDGKVYRTAEGAYDFCVGVVSDEYAMCFGASEKELKSGKKVAVALIGKVHVWTKYGTTLGQNVYVANSEKMLCVGRALETTESSTEPHKVLTLVRPKY